MPRAPHKPMAVTKLNMFFKDFLSCTVSTVPLGMQYSGRSLRSGGLSVAYTVGVPKGIYLHLRNHLNERVFFRHYVDPLLPPSEAARCFFGHLLAVKAKAVSLAFLATL